MSDKKSQFRNRQRGIVAGIKKRPSAVHPPVAAALETRVLPEIVLVRPRPNERNANVTQIVRCRISATQNKTPQTRFESWDVC